MATAFEKIQAKRVSRGEPASIPRTNEQSAATAQRNASLGFGKISTPTGSTQSTYTSNTKPNTINFTTAGPVQGKTATVLSYKDNADGTTTNTLSDGTTSTVRYTKNADGSLQPTEVSSGAVQRPVTPAPVSNTGITAPGVQSDAERALFIKLQKGDTLNDEDYGTLYDIQKARKQTNTDSAKAAQDAILAKQREAIVAEEARVKAREQELRQTTEGRVQLYREQQQAMATPEKLRAEETARNNLATSQRLLGARGNLTSSVGEQSAIEQENQRAATLNAIDSRVAAQVALYQASLEDTDAKTLQAMQDRVNTLYDAEQKAILDAETNLQNLKLTAQQAGDQALMDLVASATSALDKKKVEAGFSKEATTVIGDGYVYGVDAEGKPYRMNDASGQPIKTVTTAGGTKDQYIEVGDSLYDTVSGEWINSPESTSDVESPWEKVTYNGIDYEVNKNTGEKRNPILPESSLASTTATDSQISTVTTALSGAKKFADAAGRSSWKEAIAQGVFGATDYTNLEAYANTLRTNILTLQTDPAIKKFFGPQMSNADVQLMMSGGTILNPKLQGPKQFKEELQRIENAMNILAKSTLSSQEAKTAYDDYIKEGAEPGEALQLTKEEFPQSFNTPVSAGSTNSKAFQIALAKPDGTKGGQCGRFVNQATGLGLGDSLKSKMDKMDPNITTPGPGMVFVMPVYKNGKSDGIGHTGFIQSTYINDKGEEMATVKDSNWYVKSAPETVSTHDIPVSKMTGFRQV